MATIYRVTRPSAFSYAGARILVVRGVDRGHALAITDEEVIVGSAPTCQLVLRDPAVSRNHLSIRLLPNGYLCTDLASTNGTWLDKHRIVSAYVEPGDLLQIGDTRLRLESRRQRFELPLSQADAFGKLIGRSAAARRLFALLETVAPQDATVLLVGESGTGKDLAAEAIHDASPRAAGPFVVVDCGALPPALMESELFGHERGAFTGAQERRSGAFVEAHKGTLFLDEIAKLPRDMQPKLLRALDRRQVKPLGSDHTIDVDVRVVAASDRDLRVDVNRGVFREDLFYRLNVVPIKLPPLRERVDDIPLLANHFLRQLSGDSEAELTAEQLAALVDQQWPGNVRELRNWVERSLVLATSEADPATGELEPFKQAKARTVDAFERQYLTALLLRTEGNVAQAARLAAMDRVNFTRIMRKHGLKRR
jgi:DNA-binding NtrC family response regulator